MKKVLIISPLWTGMKDFFIEAKEISSGMPAFVNTFFMMLQDERVSCMYLILFCKKRCVINTPVKYKHKLSVSLFVCRNKTELSVKLLIALIKSLYLIIKHKINTCYGHGDVGAIAGLVSNFLRISNVRRIYGTFLYDEISKPKIYVFLKHPLSYLSFSLPAKHIVVTNDGTKGDKVFQYIGNKKTRLHFLLNGVDKNIEFKICSPSFKLPSKYISYVARISEWKRQHLAIKALTILKQKGLVIPLCIAGYACSLDYYSFLKELVKDNNLKKINFIDNVPIETSWFILKNSYLTLSLYNFSNLSNVFLESLTLGTPVVAFNNDSLAYFPKNTYYPLDFDDPETIAGAIEELWFDREKAEQISINAKKFAFDNLLDWKERSNIELDLLLNNDS
jgi:glycosyltransferase involved in cell wall biosynthesis